MVGSRKDLLRASANRTLLPIQQPSELRDPRWDQPQDIPQHEHLETGPSGTSRGIFQWKHPPGSAFTWETTQTATACRSPSLPPPHPPLPRSRCQDSSTLHCAGRDQPLPAGRSCGHQQNWQRRRDPGGGEETNNQRNQPPEKTMQLSEAGIVPAAGLDLGSVTRPPPLRKGPRRNAATRGSPGQRGAQGKFVFGRGDCKARGLFGELWLRFGCATWKSKPWG